MERPVVGAHDMDHGQSRGRGAARGGRERRRGEPGAMLGEDGRRIRERPLPRRPRHLLYPSYATIAILPLAPTPVVYHAPWADGV